MIDATGMGIAVYDRLKEDGFDVIKVIASERANEPDKFRNKRAESWFHMREWFEDHPCKIPDDKLLVADLLCVRQNPPDASGKITIELKESIIKRLKRSPDSADALALTFAGIFGNNLNNQKYKEIYEELKNRAKDYDW
jgi:hypothetical protein